MALRGTTCLLAWLWLWACLPSPANAADDRPAQAWRPVEPARLDTLRGGFVAPSGLQVSFGFERSVHVDGAAVLVQRIQVADVGRISAAEAQQLATLGQAQLVRIGGAEAAIARSAGLVIQNSLDGRRIQVQETLDVSSNALGMLQALNAAQALQSATTASRGGL